jgi:hypothetical protein
MGWVVNATPWPPFPRKKKPVTTVYEDEWEPRRSGLVRKISPPTGIQSQDRPACSELLHRLRYSGPPFYPFKINFNTVLPSFPRLPTWNILFKVPNKNAAVTPPPPYLPLAPLHLTTYTILVEQYKSQSSALRSFLGAPVNFPPTHVSS